MICTGKIVNIKAAMTFSQIFSNSVWQWRKYISGTRIQVILNVAFRSMPRSFHANSRMYPTSGFVSVFPNFFPLWFFRLPLRCIWVLRAS